MSKNLITLLLISSSVGIYYLIINPLYNGTGIIWQPDKGTDALSKLNVQYDETLSQADSLYKQAEKLQTDYINVPSDSQRELKIMVPDSVDPIRLVSEVNYIANKTGLSLRDVSYTENLLGAGNYGSYTVSFSLTTTYTKFKELMHNYETSMRLFSIENVKFDVPLKDESSTDFQVRLSTYYMK
jgi:hypothetical protein